MAAPVSSAHIRHRHPCHSGDRNLEAILMPRRSEPLVAHPCAECELLFLPKRLSTARYCSQYCQKAHYRRELLGMDPNRNYLDGEDYQQIIQMRRNGMGYQEIGEIVKAPRDTVYGIVYQYAPELIGVGTTRVCVVCEQPFTAGRPEAIYCSDYCRNRRPERVAYGREYARYWRGVQRGEIPRRAHRKETDVQPVQTTEVRRALDRAIARRLEFNLTGVWR
jgi:hypothetical protein